MARSRPVETLVDDLAGILPTGSETARARHLLKDLRHRLAAPLRVAVVGQIKAGKSSLINTMIGEPLLPVGTAETTYNVAWLRYGTVPKAILRMDGGATRREIPIGELDAWARRSSASAGTDRVHCVEIVSPCALLQSFELIDTPGLASSDGTDSSKTEMFLNLDRDSQPTEVDVALFTLRRGIHEEDEATLRSFRHDADGRVSPLNALGLVMQSDLLWPGVDNPMEAAARLARRLASQPRLRNSLYDVLAISGVLASGVDLLATDRHALESLATASPSEGERLTQSAKRFLEADGFREEISVDLRRRLLAKLGLYGINRACALLRHQDVGVVLDALREESQIPRLLGLLQGMFVPRTALVRILAKMPVLEEAALNLMQSASDTDRAAGEAWRRRLVHFASEDSALSIDLLRLYGREDLDLSTVERTELRDIATYLEDRGEAQGAFSPLTETSERIRSRMDYWRARYNDARMMGSPTQEPALAMCRALERAQAEGRDR